MTTDAPAGPPDRASLYRGAREAALRQYVNFRSLRWRVASNGPLDQDRALDYLRGVVEQMSAEQAAPIKASLDAGAMRARRLVPKDGVVFESPQGRVFAIDGLPPLIAPPRQEPTEAAEEAVEDGSPGEGDADPR